MPSTQATNGLGAQPEDWLPAGIEPREPDAPLEPLRETSPEQWVEGQVTEGPAPELPPLDDVWQPPRNDAEIAELRTELREAQRRAKQAEERAKRAEQKLEREKKRAAAAKQTKAPARPRKAAKTTEAPAAEGKVDLNAASFEALRTLGLSINQAARFIGQREERGGFRTLDDLDELYGLARSVIAELKDAGTV